MFKKMSFYDKNRNNTSNLLASALANRKEDNINTGAVAPRITSNKNTTSDFGIGGALNGAGQLYGAIKDKGLFGGEDMGNHLASNATGNTLGNLENLSFASKAPAGIDNLSFMGNSAGNIDNLSFANSLRGEPAEGGVPFLGLLSGAKRAGLSALNGGSFTEDVPQSFFNINKDDSDIMQTIGGAGQGVMMGAPFGPIGMAIGGLLGAGSSFLDDI